MRVKKSKKYHNNLLKAVSKDPWLSVYFSSKLKSNPSILLRTNIDWSIQNGNKKLLFEFFNNIPANKIGVIFDMLLPIFKKQSLDLEEKFQGDNLLHFLAKNNNIEAIKILISKTDENNFLYFNVNALDKDNNKLIDILVNKIKLDLDIKTKSLNCFKYKINPDLLLELRKAGSLEPKKQSSHTIQKIVVTPGDAPDNFYNKLCAVKIFQFLKKLYPLYNEDIIEETINNFKNSEHMNEVWGANESNKYLNCFAWDTDNIFSLSEIVDLFTNMGGLRTYYHTYSSKEILATIIKAAEAQNKLDELKKCLATLEMCPLGKFIRLVDVVQDIVFKDQIDYSKWLNTESYQLFINDVIKEIQPETDKGSILLSSFVGTIFDHKAIKPELWSKEVQLVYRIFANKFMEYNSNIDGTKLSDNYHFILGLKNTVISPFVDWVLSESSKVLPSYIGICYKKGCVLNIHKMLNFIATLENVQDINNPEMIEKLQSTKLGALDWSDADDYLLSLVYNILKNKNTDLSDAFVNLLYKANLLLPDSLGNTKEESKEFFELVPNNPESQLNELIGNDIGNNNEYKDSLLTHAYSELD